MIETLQLVPKVVRRWRRFGLANAVKYAAYRFYSVRSLGYLLKKISNHAGAPQKNDGSNHSLFPNLKAEEILEGLEKDAFFAPLRLPDSVVTEIRAYAYRYPCVSFMDHQPRQAFLYSQKRETEARSGQKLIHARYPEAASFCPAVTCLQKDPLLLEVACRYLGGEPKQTETILFWNFAAVEASFDERLQAKQTAMFHYDLDSYRMIYFNFYLTDVNTASGPHLIVRRSHQRKKLDFLFSSANQPDEKILSFYGAENIIPLYGPAGFGFAEDSFCFHKALPPVGQDRLLLQIRMLAGKQVRS